MIQTYITSIGCVCVCVCVCVNRNTYGLGKVVSKNQILHFVFQFVILLLQAFSQQIFTEHLLCARSHVLFCLLGCAFLFLFLVFKK